MVRKQTMDDGNYDFQALKSTNKEEMNKIANNPIISLTLSKGLVG